MASVTILPILVIMKFHLNWAIAMISSRNYRSGNFLYRGDTRISDRHHVIHEISTSNDVFYAHQCLVHSECTTVEICTQQGGALCRICSSSNHMYTYNGTGDCQHLQKVTEGLAMFRPTTPASITVGGKTYTVPAVYIDGVQWTVIQRRFDGSVDFNRSWVEYENRFGYYDQAFWLGNKVIHAITNRDTRLKIEMEDYNGVWSVANYESFYLQDASWGYKLRVSGKSGNATHRRALIRQNRRTFKTFDRQPSNCEVKHEGGWWYRKCAKNQMSLNAQYGIYFMKGIEWNKEYRLKHVQMLIRNL